MKRFFLIGSISMLAILSGCQQLQEQAQQLRKGGEQLYTQASQEAESIKTQIIDTKQKFDQKSQQVVNAADALNKLAH